MTVSGSLREVAAREFCNRFDFGFVGHTSEGVSYLDKQGVAHFASWVQIAQAA